MDHSCAKSTDSNINWTLLNDMLNSQQMGNSDMKNDIYDSAVRLINNKRPVKSSIYEVR